MRVADWVALGRPPEVSLWKSHAPQRALGTREQPAEPDTEARPLPRPPHADLAAPVLMVRLSVWLTLASPLGPLMASARCSDSFW